LKALLTIVKITMEEHESDDFDIQYSPVPSSPESVAREASPETRRSRTILPAKSPKLKVKHEGGLRGRSSEAPAGDSGLSEVAKARMEGYNDGYNAAVRKYQNFGGF
jgi:hypothetical protein